MGAWLQEAARAWTDAPMEASLHATALVLEERLAAGASCYETAPLPPTLLRPFADADGSALPLGAACAQRSLEALRRQARAQRKPWYMLAPSSLARTLWDTTAVLLIWVLLFTVPLSMAFYAQCGCRGKAVEGLPPSAYEGASQDVAFVTVISVLTAVFFACDVILNFLTGFYVDEQQRRVEYSLPRIAKRYATTYLLTDVLACIPFGCVMVTANPSLNYYNAGELLKLLRLYGMARREHGSPFLWIDRISEVRKEFTFQARRTVSFFLVLLAVCHAFGCLLWIVLRAQHFPEDTWPVQLNVLYSPVVTQWLWSFFNTISGAIGIGWGPYSPVTWPEALVWLFAMLVESIMFAVLTGYIFSYILAVSAVKQEYAFKMDGLLWALKERGVPLQLRNQIIDYVQSKYVGRRVAHDEEAMQELPPTIRAQVALLSCGGLLAQVPLFAQHQAVLEEVAPLLQRWVALPGQVVVQQGHVLQSIWFVRRGYVDLSIAAASGDAGKDAAAEDGSSSGSSGSRLVDTLGPGDYFGDRALLPAPIEAAKQLGLGLREQLLAGSWWRAPFTATALNHCELFMLPAAAWHRVLQNHADLAAELAEEAARFVARVASALPPGSSSGKGSPAPADGLGVAEEKAASLRLGRIDRSMTRPRGQNSLLAAGSLRRIDVSQD